MQEHALTFVRGVVILAAVMLAIMFGGLLIDLLAGYQLHAPFHFEIDSARHFNNLLNRNLNQLVAIVFMVVAIAVPLTANLYSLKFLEFFIKDPVNAAVLIFVVFTDLNNTWTGYWHKETVVPLFQLNLTFFLTIFCFALQFPYLYYVFRFLHPQTLVQRLEAATIAALKAVPQQRSRLPERRREVAEGIEHLVNIATRSVERSDRNTAIESIMAVKRVVETYWEMKPQMPAPWFEAEPRLFLGLSTEALAEVNDKRIWVGMKVLGQFRELLNVAIGRMPDAVSAIARTTQAFGLGPGRSDAMTRELIVVYFNTFLRLAVNRRDTRTVFVMLDAYRALAEAWNAEYPEEVLEIAFYFTYYGRLARDLGQPFLVEFGAYTLAGLVRYAWEHEAPNRQQLLERFLHYDAAAKTPLAGVRKAQAILASFFLMRGDTEAVDHIRDSFRGLDADFLVMIQDELQQVRHEEFWEVSEGRRANMDYVPDAQRAKLQGFFEQVLPAENCAASVFKSQ